MTGAALTPISGRGSSSNKDRNPLWLAKERAVEGYKGAQAVIDGTLHTIWDVFQLGRAECLKLRYYKKLKGENHYNHKAENQNKRAEKFRKKASKYETGSSITGGNANEIKKGYKYKMKAIKAETKRNEYLNKAAKSKQNKDKHTGKYNEYHNNLVDYTSNAIDHIGKTIVGGSDTIRGVSGAVLHLLEGVFRGLNRADDKLRNKGKNLKIKAKHRLNRSKKK